MMDAIHTLNLALLLGACVLCVYMLHKVRRVHQQQFALADMISALQRVDFVNLFRQIEAARALRERIGLSAPLMAGGWAASADFLWLLTEHTLAAKPENIIECGSGLSTLILARCAQLNGLGHVYSLDHDAEFAEATRLQLCKYGLQDYATVIHAPLMRQSIGGEECTWYDLAAIRKGPATYDMVIVDGPPMPFGKMIRMPAGPVLIARLATGGAVFIDDAARHDERAMIDRWRSAFPDLIYKAPHAEKGCAVLYRAATNEFVNERCTGIGEQFV